MKPGLVLLLVLWASPFEAVAAVVGALVGGSAA